MLTTEMLHKELMARCLDGKAFTVVKELGRFRSQAVKTAEGWQEQPLDPIEPIQAAAAEVRKLAEKFPELNITYPQQLLSEQQPVGDDSLRFTLRRTNAVIKVPEEFARLHSGSDFRRLLEDEWSGQVSALTDAVCKMLRKYELRTARMFSAQYDRTSVVMQIARENISTEIWQLPFSRYDLYPLLWDSEVCGMAQLLRDRLRGALKEDCDDSHVLTVLRNEQKQQCLLRLTFVQME